MNTNLVVISVSIRVFLCVTYHEALTMPGISPLDASSRKQILHKSKARMYPPFRPQRQQRLTTLVEYWGLVRDLNDLMYCALVAMVLVISN